MSEQAYGQVRVLRAVSRRAGKLVRRQKGVELLRVVICVGIVGIRRREIAGEARQTGVMRGEIDERDLAPLVGGHRRPLREEPSDGLVELHLTALHGTGEEQRGEGLRDRADLEDRVFVERRSAWPRRTVADEAALPVFENADRDAARATTVDAGFDDLENRRVRRHGLRAHRLRGGERQSRNGSGTEGEVRLDAGHVGIGFGEARAGLAPEVRVGPAKVKDPALPRPDYLEDSVG